MEPAFVDDHDVRTPGPIADLAPELLIEIFIWSVADIGDDLLPLRLALVCHQWRDIVLSNSRIWQTIYLHQERSFTLAHKQARLWLERSGTLPFDVRLHLMDPDDILSYLSPFLSHIRRWQRCTLTGFFHDTFHFDELLKDTNVDHLQHLQLVIKDAVTGFEFFAPLWDSHAPIPEGQGFPVHPLCLYVSGPDEMILRVSLCKLPKANTLTDQPLITVLTIAECSRHVYTHPVDMLRLLDAFPMLEIFRYYGSPSDGSRVSPHSRCAITRLPHLRVLSVHSTCYVRTILSHIHAPVLSELHLKHTNIDFQLRHDPYADLHEIGDSDDEADDFSQSPWSDHATGMGLRALIQRCRPPLKHLVMDYTDMRTKDFAWCFDQLDSLETFYIVGSDMSNSVIQMLAPFRRTKPRRSNSVGSRLVAPFRRRRRGGSEEQAITTPVEEGGNVCVRLPRLKVLRLEHCEQLSGNAIVDALRARVRHTDAAAKEEVPRCETLGEVSITRCMDFSVHHSMDLSATLGPRFRAT